MYKGEQTRGCIVISNAPHRYLLKGRSAASEYPLQSRTSFPAPIRRSGLLIPGPFGFDLHNIASVVNIAVPRTQSHISQKLASGGVAADLAEFATLMLPCRSKLLDRSAVPLSIPEIVSIFSSLTPSAQCYWHMYTVFVPFFTCIVALCEVTTSAGPR